MSRQVYHQRLVLGADEGHGDKAKRTEKFNLDHLARCRVRIALDGAVDQHVLGTQVELDARSRRDGLHTDAAMQYQAADAKTASALRDRREHVDLADEIRDEGACRIAIDLLRSADLLDSALIHHDDLVGHGQRFLLIVRDHDGGHAEPLLQRADLAAQAQAFQRIERGQRLVQQQEPRRSRQGAGQRDALLLAAGELPGILRPRIGQSDELEQLGDAALDRVLPFAPIDEPVRDIGEDGQIREQRVGLKYDAVVALHRRQPRDVTASLDDRPLVLRLEPGNDAQKRRLTAARWTEKDHELAGLDREGDAGERGELPEPLGDSGELEVRLVGGNSRCGHGLPCGVPRR